MKVDYRTALLDCGAIFRTEYRTAAGGYNQIGFARQFSDHFRLPIAKALLTLDVEYQWNSDAGARFDFVIGIDEGSTQTPGQLATDCRLSGARHADQEEVVVSVQI